ncbi:MAG TPA: hypothetical protein VHE59_04160 [Mucilaginibacter sp.]|nr:hypothetical protein [Mucilaginibacter sp.]
MLQNVYLLTTDSHIPCRDIIHSRDTALKLRVICLGSEKFERDPDEIQLYGTAKGVNYAFETMGVTSNNGLDVVEAIQWYAGYINCPELKILTEDPRPGKRIAL